MTRYVVLFEATVYHRIVPGEEQLVKINKVLFDISTFI